MARKAAAEKQASGKPPKQQAGAAEPRPGAPRKSADRPTNRVTAVEKRQDLNAYQRIRRLLADVMKEAADLRGQSQSLLKAHEKKGGNPKMLVLMAKLEDMGKAEAEESVSDYFEYARDIGIRVSFDAEGQGSLDDVLGGETTVRKGDGPEMDLSEARAYDDGRNSYKQSPRTTADDNPFNQGTIEHQGWKRGFDDALREASQANVVPMMRRDGADMPADPA